MTAKTVLAKTVLTSAGSDQLSAFPSQKRRNKGEYWGDIPCLSSDDAADKTVRAPFATLATASSGGGQPFASRRLAAHR